MGKCAKMFFALTLEFAEDMIDSKNNRKLDSDD